MIQQSHSGKDENTKRYVHPQHSQKHYLQYLRRVNTTSAQQQTTGLRECGVYIYMYITQP